MPRIISMARSRPARSSSVRCSASGDAAPGSVRAVSVAIWRHHPFSSSPRTGIRRRAARVWPWRRGIAADVRASWGEGYPQSVADSDRVERLWPRRLRWRMRGAWLWPAFFGLTALDGLVIWKLPPYEGAPPGLVGGMLLAGFANLALIALVAPLVGRRLRRVRQDLPRLIAVDYAGTALVGMLAVLVVAAGLVHRPAIAAREDARTAAVAAVRDRVSLAEPQFAVGLGAEDVLELEPD